MDARLRRAVRDAGYEPRSMEAVEADANNTSPWAGFAPVAFGLLLACSMAILWRFTRGLAPTTDGSKRLPPA